MCATLITHHAQVFDGSSVHTTDGCKRTMRSCRPGGRRTPLYPITHIVIPPRSHDLNPLETAFAQLQAMVGNHFLYHSEEVSRQKIIEKVGEYWPMCHELCVQLMANQPAVMDEIYVSRGQSTGR